ncbi:DUF2505 family protein [Nocardioides flavescens]|uniref:DUF2505 family protein n=1 Tax=Nocardioides flavescens TaxID=2691959 RepID=A0A6L7EXE5_9ACTN|nr:DUF2505 family protein [Nocardioides flavescens]
MTKHVTHTMTYDAPASEVYAMLTTPSFREEVARRTKVESVTATVSDEGSGHAVEIDQVQRSRGLPSFAAKFVGDTMQIVQRERWTGGSHGDIEVTIPGKPGEMSGTADLVEKDGVTTETVEMDIKVKVPLVGGKIEGLIADMLVRALETEEATGREHLSG